MFKCQTWTLVGRQLFAAAFVAVGFSLPPATSAVAQGDGADQRSAIVRITSPAELPLSKSLTLGLGRALIYELPVDAQDTVISDPKTLDVAVLTPRRVMLFAKTIGTSNVFVLGREGRRILILDVTVKKDVSDLAKMLQSLLPGSKIKVTSSGEGVVLSGTVSAPADSARAAEMASQHLGAAKVVNLITAGVKEQVLLKVTVAELQRDAIRRIGINLPEAVVAGGSFAFSKVIANNFPVSATTAGAAGFIGAGQVPSVASGSALQASSTWSGGSVTAMLEMLERVGLSRTLSEPTLVAISGEPAKFHAGGELPVPVSQANNTISVAWKPIGVSVSFTPFVLSEGRISLKVAAEVSELSSVGAISTQGISIPAIQVRRAETVVEMPSGSALAMAGLLSDQTRRNVDGVPELRNLPVLGSLFSSKDFKSNQSELVILVTPYIVRPTEQALLSRPDDGLLSPSPLRGLFRGHLNRIYSQVPADVLKGDYGYIVDHPSPSLKE